MGYFIEGIENIFSGVPIRYRKTKNTYAPINVKPQGGGDGLPTGILTFWGKIRQIPLH